MAFSHVKNAVLASVSRTRFDPELPLNCYTDASGFGIGAVMLQKEFPVAIVSPRSSGARKKLHYDRTRVAGSGICN